MKFHRLLAGLTAVLAACSDGGARSGGGADGAADGADTSIGGAADGAVDAAGGDLAGPPLPAPLTAIGVLDEQGRPILLESPALLPSGLRLALVYDQALDDPLTRWAECLALVRACLPPGAADPDACVAALPRCATDAGGPGCCAPACVAAWDAARAGGADAEAAWEASFLEGRCVAGLAALVGSPEEVSP